MAELLNEKGLMLAAFSVKTSKLSMVFVIFKIHNLNILRGIFFFWGGGGLRCGGEGDTVMTVDRVQLSIRPWFGQSHCFPGPSPLQFVMDSCI